MTRDNVTDLSNIVIFNYSLLLSYQELFSQLLVSIVFAGEQLRHKNMQFKIYYTSHELEAKLLGSGRAASRFYYKT